MSESISSRVGRILSGGINAIIDSIENSAPDLVMEEAIREIDSAIYDVRSELGTVVANRHLANKRMMEENKKYEDLSEKIEFAVNEGRDDLAEAAIAQQINIEAQIPVLEKSITEATESEKELEGYIVALKAKKREMREELRSFVESRKQTVTKQEDGKTISGSSDVVAKVEKAQEAFDRIMEKGTGIGPSSSSTTDTKTAAQIAELDKLSHQNRIKERLAKIKAEKKG